MEPRNFLDSFYSSEELVENALGPILSFVEPISSSSSSSNISSTINLFNEKIQFWPFTNFSLCCQEIGKLCNNTNEGRFHILFKEEFECIPILGVSCLSLEDVFEDVVNLNTLNPIQLSFIRMFTKDEINLKKLNLKFPLLLTITMKRLKDFGGDHLMLNFAWKNEPLAKKWIKFAIPPFCSDYTFVIEIPKEKSNYFECMTTFECFDRKIKNDNFLSKAALAKRILVPLNHDHQHHINNNIERANSSNFNSTNNNINNGMPKKAVINDICQQCCMGRIVSCTFPCLHAVLCSACLKKNSNKKKCVICDRKYKDVNKLKISTNIECLFCEKQHDKMDGLFDCIYIPCSCVLGFFDCALSYRQIAPQKCENCQQKVISYRQLLR